MKLTRAFWQRLSATIVGFVIFLMAAIWSGWSPFNLLLGPGYEHSRGSRQSDDDIPPDGAVIDSFKEKASWLAEYAQLNEAVDMAGGSLAASYRTGPDGSATVHTELRRGPGRALTLMLNSPPEAVKTLDASTPTLPVAAHRTIIELRDTDLDGMPNEVCMEPAGQPVFRESFTDDGFMFVRDNAEHTAFLVQWTIGLAYWTDQLLHTDGPQAQ